MPAVVRGGRRQAAGQPTGKASDAKAAPAKRNAGTAKAPRGGVRKTGAPGKSAVIGSIHMPNELTAWFAVLVIAGLLAVVLLTGHRAQAVGQVFTNFADNRIASLGLKLQNVRLVGVSDIASPDIKKAMKFERGQPLALMDLAKVQADIEAVGWVKEASVRRQFPGLLIVSVVERPRLAVWQYQGKNSVIDDQGHVIPEAAASKFPELPYIVGEGANEVAPDIIELMQARPALMQKTYALQRVDTRRWNILLKNGAVIKLPALNQDQAMIKLDSLIAQQRVLDQGLAEIDLLDPNSLVVVPLEAHAAASATPST